MTRQRTLLESKLIAEVCPILQDALHLIGHQATRTRGTIGGSLCNMDPSAELFGVAALHNATLRVRSSRGEREIEVSDWAETFMKPSMAKTRCSVRSGGNSGRKGMGMLSRNFRSATTIMQSWPAERS
jgi:CO/xanthine dehydrogenase FAD-binding subunit